jgi:outer membrane protein OmpA-like peptidoglycan-associated protein
MDFTEIRMVNGRMRFVDRAIEPPFSEEITRLSMRIQNLSNVLGRPERTTVTVQGLVGRDGALDARGQFSGLGESLRGELVAELRDFALATANPYADSMTSWVVERGTLQAKLHYTVEGDRVTAEHELAFKDLQVQKRPGADTAERRIGIPLGLAVALLKDSSGNIELSIPLTGSLSEQRFNWGDAIWGAVKQVIGKVVLSPFRAIGRLLSGGGEGGGAEKLAVDPVTFAPGSAIVAPSVEAQLTHVAEFLQRSPKIALGLVPIVTAADVESLKRRQARQKVEAFRRAESLPDTAAALAAYYRRHLPDVALPPTEPEQFARIADAETVTDDALADLAQRRAEAVRDGLVAGRSVPADRVVVRPRAAAAPAQGDGRVELSIGPAEG